ncbi:MAG: methionine--tRNA ligase subunit beta, partial [Desulfonatronovibrio sp.]
KKDEAQKPQKAKKEPKENLVQFEDFQKMKLVTGRILEAQTVEGADKLYKLSVDIGKGEPRQVVAGLAEFFKPQELIGRDVVVLANLAPRKIRGVMSHGMILAVRQGKKMSLLKADPQSDPGNRVS